MIVDPQRLIDLLPGQRWFGFKHAAIRGATIVDQGILDDGPPALTLVIASVDVGGTTIWFQLPLLVDDEGNISDATAEPQRLTILGDLMAHGDSIKGDHGVFHFGGAGLDPLAPRLGDTSVRVMDAEQSNSSVVFDEHVILKFFRKLAPGPNPDLELSRLLTSEGFDNTPAQVGEITYEGELDGDDITVDLAIAQQLVQDAVEGWSWLLADLARFYDEVDPADVAEDRTFLTEERARASLTGLEELGDVTASLHVALSRDELDPDLVPDPTGQNDVDGLIGRIGVALKEAPATALKGLARILKRLEQVEDAGAKTRIHGDYHLGQVLRSQRGWMILDFEGEPLRPLEERRAKQSSLKDVAGMLRSFNYVAMAALFQRAEPGTDRWHELEPWADTWEALARDRFLTAYLTRAHEGRFLPGDRDDLAILLDAYEIEKALYELEYERGHRPDWTRIPERGLERIAERVTT